MCDYGKSQWLPKSLHPLASKFRNGGQKSQHKSKSKRRKLVDVGGELESYTMRDRPCCHRQIFTDAKYAKNDVFLDTKQEAVFTGKNERVASIALSFSINYNAFTGYGNKNPYQARATPDRGEQENESFCAARQS